MAKTPVMVIQAMETEKKKKSGGPQGYHMGSKIKKWKKKET